MAQRRVEQDDNVTIVHTKIPEGKVTSITYQDPPQEYVRVRLSDQARQYLRRQGYSEKFIRGLHMMLQESTNLIHNTIIRSDESGEGPGVSVPSKPERMHMPSDLRSSWSQLGEGSSALIMPDIGPYFPNTTYYPETNRAFASAEGQRFMRRYYTTGWLRRDEQSGEWTISPPAPLAQITPRRTQ
jgi:hypothetical protein